MTKSFFLAIYTVLIAYLFSTTDSLSATPTPPVSSICNNGGFADVVEDLQNSVVNVFTTQKSQKREIFDNDWFFRDLEEFFEKFGGKPKRDTERDSMSLGSGFVIDADHALTNNHVIDGASEITVKFYDGSTSKATLVGADPNTDIAVLKIEKRIPEAKPLRFGDSDAARVGDWVIAIGNPFGLGGSVTAGIISARARNINLGPFDDFIQVDAAINRGNSGGPLFNTNGEVIGMNTAIFSPSGGSAGIGFATPANTIKTVTERILTEGKIVRGWLGVIIQPVSNEIAQYYNKEKPTGALVAQVTSGSPAEKAGLKPGDLIIKINEEELKTVTQLSRTVAHTKIGSTVSLGIIRGTKNLVLKAQIEEMPESLLNEKYDFKEYGNGEDIKKSNRNVLPGAALISLNDLSIDLKSRLRLTEYKNGIYVEQVERGSKAEKAGLKKGQVILEANNEKMDSVSDLSREKKKSKKNDKPILMLVSSNAGSIFIAFPTDE